MIKMFEFHNIQSGETVHQRCVLISGRCNAQSKGRNIDYITVQTRDAIDNESFPDQRWPLSHGWFKALVMLNPGQNKLVFDIGTGQTDQAVLNLSYVPLLQTPPLHLAILVAKDSPLLMDCSAQKYGAISGAHSSLEAAIAKFRMTAYMWQALTAAEMFSNGIQRRSFRLEEEWSPETVSLSNLRQKSACSTAKVHLVRTDKMVAELRDAKYAQQNSKAQEPNELHAIFTEALLKHGSPFDSELQPVVAGLILDSTYNMNSKMIVGHAALGAHNPRGLSLGIFGSHLTYSWPRFMEEVSDCLLDTTSPGSLVGDDNGECKSMWEACSVGQGAFLHEVGHAFSAPHSSGIMLRGYSKDWPKCFLSMTAKRIQSGEEGIEPVTLETPNDCRWDIRDLLRFANLAHFRLPEDATRDSARPTIEVEDEENTDNLQIVISCKGGIGRVLLNGQAEAAPSISAPQEKVVYQLNDLEAKYDLTKPLEIEVIAMNGKHNKTDVAKLLSSQSTIRIPGTGIRLQKKSVKAHAVEKDDWTWTVMLKKRSRDDRIVAASKVDLRVGCALDGAIVYYKDGTQVPCGPRGKNGDDPHMGGHQARKIAIPRGVEISKVAVTPGGYWLDGLRMTLSNGKAMGALNKGSRKVEVLEPDEGQQILGFHGVSGPSGMCKEFGIVTGPRNKNIPDSIYDMPELQNNPKRQKSVRASKRARTDVSDTEEEEEEEVSTSEDEDGDYDEDMDDY